MKRKDKRQFCEPVSQLVSLAGKPANRQTKKGLTFIELLVVTTMLSVISLAISSTFGQGLKIYQRISGQVLQEDLNIFLDKFTSDLKNSFKFTGIPFRGNAENLEFATLVSSPPLAASRVGKAVYLYDKGRLSRWQMDFSALYTGDQKDSQGVLKNIKKAKFSYYFYDAKKKQYCWQEEWEEEDLPLAVRLELELDDDEDYKFVRTVNIPVAG